MRHAPPLLLAGAAVFVVMIGGGSARAEWKELGPAPLGVSNGSAGRVTALVAHPTDNDVFYLGAAAGGVWKYAAGRWLPLTDGMPFNAIGALALDPARASTLYAGTGEPNAAFHSFYGVGIYKSIDAGASWVHLAEEIFGGRAISRIVVSPVEGQVLYASVMRTGDELDAGSKGHPGAGGPLGVFRSSDGGTSWSHISGGLPAVDASDVVMTPGNPTALYAAIGAHRGDPSNGVYKTTDGGDSWTELAGGLPAGAGRISLGIAPSRPDRVYALVARPADLTGAGSATLGIYTTDNGGSTWRSLVPPNFMGDQGLYNNCVAVDPKNADIAYFGGVTIKKTLDGGNTIAVGVSGDVTSIHVDNHAFAFAAGGDLLVGQDGGVNRSTDGGGSWTRINQGLGINQIYGGISIHPSDVDFLLGGFQDNGTGARTGVSAVWRTVLGADGGYTAVITAAPNIQFATIYDAGSLYRSTNGGQSFPLSSTGISGNDRTAFFQVTVPSPADPQVVFTATHRLYKSSDQGVTWIAWSGDLTGGGQHAIRALAISSSGAILWVATTDNRVMMSQDGGQTFSQKLEVPGGFPRVTRELAVAPWDEKVAFVAVQRFGTDQVRMTRDLGTTWAAIDGNLPDVPVNTVDAATVQGRHMIFVGTDGGVFYTCNDGVHWIRLGQTLPNTVVSDVRYDPVFHRVVVSTMGRGAWSIEAPEVGRCDDDGGIAIDGAGEGRDTLGPTGGSGQAGEDASMAAGGRRGDSPEDAPFEGSMHSSGDVGAAAAGGASSLAMGGIGFDGNARGSAGESAATSKGGRGQGSGQDSGCACGLAPRRDGMAAGLGVLGLAWVFSRRRARAKKS